MFNDTIMYHKTIQEIIKIIFKAGVFFIKYKT